MVTHYMFRTHDGKWVFSGKNTRFATTLDVIKNLGTGRITDIAPYVRTS